MNGKILTEVSDGEFGIRSFVKAFDARTGAAVWKMDTIPGSSEPGRESWTPHPGNNCDSTGVRSARVANGCAGITG